MMAPNKSIHIISSKEQNIKGILKLLTACVKKTLFVEMKSKQKNNFSFNM
jgi:hypothetical protein